MNQSCYVRWCSKKSESIPVQNGVRQGAILSCSLFSVYLDSFLQDLRSSGLGCHIGGVYCGAFGYADDILLLSPSRESLQLMLKICEDYSVQHSMLFSTDVDPAKSKSKCLIFSKKNLVVTNVKLNGDDLPWVTSAKHLGSLLSSKVFLS